MSPRFTLVLAATAALVAVAACASAARIPAPTTGAAVPPSQFVPVGDPTPVPIPPAERPVPTATPIIGDVDPAPDGPELSIVDVDAETIQASLDEPTARAWRVTIAGTGELAGDRWEITVETGDVGPDITATEVVGGRVVDTMDLSGYLDGTAAAGGCHSTLPVCLDSTGFRLPQDGDGHFSVRLVLPDAGTPLVITGATASWPGEPFVLGPWHETAAFPWDANG